MGFMDGLKKLTQPYDDDEDFFEGADLSFKPQPKQEQKSAVSAAQMAFENAFADAGAGPAPEDEPQTNKKSGAADGGIFGNLGLKKGGRAKGQRTVNFGGKETSVLLFSPKSFDEAGELVSYLQQDLTVVMTLESVPAETARRLLDFLSGIAYALGGKITPVSAKTYFITPANVDILGAQPEQPESSGHYF
ncbi:MAG: cell division protein SepF [Oscillospiraceae bacterium]|nr:cell division protein SepF [Oscillospiraceae bacterium]